MNLGKTASLFVLASLLGLGATACSSKKSSGESGAGEEAAASGPKLIVKKTSVTGRQLEIELDGVGDAVTLTTDAKFEGRQLGNRFTATLPAEVKPGKQSLELQAKDSTGTSRTSIEFTVPKDKPKLDVKDGAAADAKASPVKCTGCAGSLNMNEKLEVTLAFKGADGDVVEIGSDKATVKGGEAKLSLSTLPFTAKTPLSKISGGVTIPIVITPASADLDKLETSVKLEGKETLRLTYKATSRMGLTFPGDRAAPTKPHTIGVHTFLEPRVIGNAATLADIDLVAIEEIQTNQVGSCLYGLSTGGTSNVAVMQNDSVDRVYDRRTGKLVSERRFLATRPQCPETLSPSETSVRGYADSSKMEEWRSTLIEIVPLPTDAPVDAAPAASSAPPAESSAPVADAAPPPPAPPAPTQGSPIAAYPPPQKPTAAPPPAPTPTPTPTPQRPKIPVLRRK